MPQQTPEQVKEYWDAVKATGRRGHRPPVPGGLSFGSILAAVARNVARAACVVMILFGLIGLFMPFHERFLSDNTMGATANAAERLAETVRAAVFAIVGLGFYALLRPTREKPE